MNQLSTLLAATYSAINNEQRKQVQDTLQKMHTEPGFLKALADIMMSQQGCKKLHIVEQLKTAASTYVIKYTKEAMQLPINNDKAKQCVNSILMMLEMDIPFHLKRRFATALHLVLDKMGRPIRQELTKYLLVNIVECRSNDSLNILKYEQLSQIACPIIINSKDDNRMGETVLEINLSFVNFIHKAQSQLKIHLNQPNSPYTLRLIGILKALLQNIKITLKNIKFDKMPQIVKIVFSDELQTCLMNAIKIYPPGISIESCIFLTGQSGIARQLNQIKASCVTIMTAALKLLFKNILQPSLVSMNPLFAKGKIYLDMFIESVCTLLRMTSIADIHSSQIKELLESILTNINMLLTNPLYLGYFEQVRSRLYQNIVRPLLVSSNEDVDMFIEEPVSFVQSVIFTWKGWRLQEEDASKDQTIKSNAAHMLSNICRYQDGFTKRFFQDTMEKLKNLSGMQRILYLQMLAIIQPNTNQRQQILQAMERFLMRQLRNPAIQNYQSKLERMQLFYLLFLLYAYTKPIDAYDSVFAATFSAQIALSFLAGQSVRINQSCQLICVFILKEVGQVNSLAIYQLSTDILHFICSKLGCDTYIEMVLDYLSQILQKNAEILMQNPQNLIICVTLLTRRIQKMVDLPDSKPIVNRCWNCIREIVANRIFNSLTNQIEPIISSLYQFISRPNIDFDEDILIVVIQFIKKSKTISEQHALLFQQFPKLFQKNKHRFLNLFECLNIYLLYGNQLFSTSSKAVEVILEMCLKAMFAVDPRAINEADNCEGVLLIQNLIYSLGQTFSEAYWVSILENCQKRLKWRFISNVFFSGNLIATIAMCLEPCMRINSTKAQHYLNLALVSLTYLMDEHPCKLYSSYLSKLLMNYEIPLIGSNFLHILDCITTLLRLNYSRKSYIEEVEIQLEDKSQDEKDYLISMSVFECALKDIDAYDIFKKTIYAIKKNEPQKMEKILMELIPEKKQYLRTLMGLTKTVDGEYRAILKVKRS